MGGNPVKSARLVLKVARTEVLDGFFLPSATTSAESALALKDAVSSVSNADTSVSAAMSVSVSSRDKAAIILERRILKNHKSFSAEKEKYEKLRSEIHESSDSHRQMITAMRCLLRNIAAPTPVRKRESGQATYSAAPALRDSLVEVLSSAVGDLFESCRVFQTALSTLQQTQSSNQSAAQSSVISDALRQCEEMFECTRGFTGLGSYRYLVADIPAAMALYSPKTETAAPKRSRNTASTVSIRILPASTPVVRKRLEITAKVFAERSSEFLSSLLVPPVQLLTDQLTLQLQRSFSSHNARYTDFLATLSRSETVVRMTRLQHAWQRSSTVASSDSDFASVVSWHIIYEYYSPLPLMEDMQVLAMMRGSKGMQECRFREFKKVETTFAKSSEAVAARLLLIDSIDAFGTKDKLALYTALWRQNKNGYNDALCRAFENEMASVTQNLADCDGEKGRRQEDMFSLAMRAGHRFLTQPRIQNSPFDIQYSGCIALTTFLTLAERYVVLSMVYERQCEGVCLPVSLLMNVMCRKNAAYANMIRCCAAAERWRKKVGYVSYDILALLMRILTSSVIDLQRWESASKHEDEEKLNDLQRWESASKHEDEEKLNPAMAVSRISYLIVTIIANIPSHIQLPQIVINKHLLEGLPKDLSVTVATLAFKRPSVKSHVYLCESLKDTLVCVTLSDKVHSAHTHEMKKLAKAILTTKDDSVIITIKPAPPKGPSAALGQQGTGTETETETGWTRVGNGNEGYNVPPSLDQSSFSASDAVSDTDDASAPLSADMDLTSELEDWGSSDQLLPTQSRISFYDKCCTVLTVKLSEARERLKTLTPTGRLERDLELSFREVSGSFLVNVPSRASLNRIVKLYISSLSEKLLAVRDCIAVIERLGRSSEDNQVT
jgi:hypothetical protein